jgi:hypothetical protein
VSDAGAADEDAGEEAGEDAAVDADSGPSAVPIGGACRVDDECETDLCGTSTILTTAMTAGTGPVCTKTCCTSADCPSGFVCFSGGTGGNYCVEAAKWERTPPATGGKAPGVTCGGNAECRSGLCRLGRCFDTCCLAADCASGTTCRVTTTTFLPPPAHDIWVCAPSPAGADAGPGQSCQSATCLNDNCVGSGVGRVCRPSCCGKKDCETQLSNNNAHCAYSTSGTDQLKFCFLTTNTSGLPNGSDCGTSTQCQSDYCDAELQKCLSICCEDSDCPTGDVCRPSGVSTPFLRCVAAR